MGTINRIVESLGNPTLDDEMEILFGDSALGMSDISDGYYEIESAVLVSSEDDEAEEYKQILTMKFGDGTFRSTNSRTFISTFETFNAWFKEKNSDKEVLKFCGAYISHGVSNKGRQFLKFTPKIEYLNGKKK